MLTPALEMQYSPRLGEATVADEVVIDWPTFPAYQERFENVRGDRIATYVEGSGEVVDAGAGGSGGESDDE
jgi:hypothetical protein